MEGTTDDTHPFDDPQGARRRPATRAEGALLALEDSLAAAIPGLRVLDRELELDAPGASRIDFAGVDREGRLVLVLLVDETSGAGDAAALAALDLVGLGRSHGYLIARHLEVAETPAVTCGVRCVLVAEDFGAVLLQRLALFGDELALFSLRSLRSARGTRTYLVPVSAESGASLGAPVVAPEQTLEQLLGALEPEQRRVAELLVTRMQRMDSEFDLRPGDGRVDWTFHGHEFLTLGLTIGLEGGLLEGRVLPGGAPIALEAEPAVEALVEQAFGAYVRLLGEFDELSEADGFGSDSFGSDALVSGAVLSAEEIAAFQA